MFFCSPGVQETCALFSSQLLMTVSAQLFPRLLAKECTVQRLVWRIWKERTVTQSEYSLKSSTVKAASPPAARRGEMGEERSEAKCV